MKKLVVFNTTGLLLLAGFVLWQITGKSKSTVVYVDSIKLFNAYQFKKDRYNNIEQSFGHKMAVMDSLEQLAVAGNLSPEHINNFESDRETLSREIAASKSETDQAIWEQLNQVIKKFGDQEQYELIIGANGMGTVLYGKVDKDITDAVIKYANGDYENK